MPIYPPMRNTIKLLKPLLKIIAGENTHIIIVREIGMIKC